MSNTREYKDIIAFHPGYYIADMIEDMGVTQAEFAIRLGTNTKTLSYLVNGQANVTNDLAKKLSAMTGTSIELWLNLQKSYDQKLIEIQRTKDLDEQASVARAIDYTFFTEVAGLPATRVLSEKVSNLCSWFKVSDLRILLHQDFLINYRTAVRETNEKNIINSRAWVQTAINLSSRIETKPYSSDTLRKHLPELRSMTKQSPDVFIPRMREILADSGVAFVVLPHLKNSGVNGAVKWINDERVILAMNNRRLNADVFWFSFFHEIKHVLQKKTKTVFVNYGDMDQLNINGQMEDDADNFAKNYLIPPSSLRKFAPSQYTSDAEIISFAESIDIHPGIVAGRLQYEKILSQSRCSQLKEKYDFTEIYDRVSGDEA